MFSRGRHPLRQKSSAPGHADAHEEAGPRSPLLAVWLLRRAWWSEGVATRTRWTTTSCSGRGRGRCMLTLRRGVEVDPTLLCARGINASTADPGWSMSLCAPSVWRATTLTLAGRAGGHQGGAAQRVRRHRVDGRQPAAADEIRRVARGGWRAAAHLRADAAGRAQPAGRLRRHRRPLHLRRQGIGGWKGLGLVKNKYAARMFLCCEQATAVFVCQPPTGARGDNGGLRQDCHGGSGAHVCD